MKSKIYVPFISICILLFVLNCARMTTHEFKNIGVYTVFELAGIMVQLVSLDSQTNIDGLQTLSDRYDVDIVVPVQNFFDSAKILILSLDELRQAMYAKTNTRSLPSQEQKEMMKLREELEKFFKDIDELNNDSNVLSVPELAEKTHIPEYTHPVLK